MWEEGLIFWFHSEVKFSWCFLTSFWTWVILVYFNFYCPPLSRKRGDIKSHSSVRPSVLLSVCLSVCQKNFNHGHNFCTITGRALILDMCVLCDKTFLMVPCCDLNRDLSPTSRSNLLPSGGPQFSEFACCNFFRFLSGIDYFICINYV